MVGTGQEEIYVSDEAQREREVAVPVVEDGSRVCEAGFACDNGPLATHFSVRDARHYGWPGTTAFGALCEAKARVSAAEQSHVRRVHRTEPHGCTG